MAVTKEQKTEVKTRPAVRHNAQALLQEIYHYFDTVHGTQPTHKEVVAVATELLTEETK